MNKIVARALRIHSPSRHITGNCWCGAPSEVLAVCDSLASALAEIDTKLNSTNRETSS